jgi:hypothetical protein
MRPFSSFSGEIAGTCDGDSKEKFLAAMSRVQAYTAAGAPALTHSFMATAGWEQLNKTRSIAYFAHEYLPSAWQPLYVTEARARMADIGLLPAGSATVGDNFDNFVLRASEREALADVADPDLRELIRDFFLNQRFRLCPRRSPDWRRRARNAPRRAHFRPATSGRIGEV